jgi:hypothetical protein
MSPRFFFDAPPPTSIGDRLLAEAHSVDIRLMKDQTGNVNVQFELKGCVGSELWLADDEETDAADESRKSHEALAFARSLLCGFAAAKGGDS